MIHVCSRLITDVPYLNIHSSVSMGHAAYWLLIYASNVGNGKSMWEKNGKSAVNISLTTGSVLTAPAVAHLLHINMYVAQIWYIKYLSALPRLLLLGVLCWFLVLKSQWLPGHLHNVIFANDIQYSVGLLITYWRTTSLKSTILFLLQSLSKHIYNT